MPRKKQKDSLGWVDGKGGTRKALSMCPPGAHPASQQQEKPLGGLEDTNILSERDILSRRANQTCG